MVRHELQAVDPTQLLIADSVGDMVRLFKYSAPDAEQPPPEAGAIRAEGRMLTPNEEALNSLLHMAHPRLYIDGTVAAVARRPRVKCEFEELTDAEVLRTLMQQDFVGAPPQDNPLRFWTVHGSRVFLAHTDFKWVRTNSAAGMRDIRGTRRLLARLEELPGIAHVSFASPHTIFYSVPRMLTARLQELQAEILTVLCECAEFIWQHWTVPDPAEL